MKSSLKNDLGLLILRIAGGGMIMTHGIPKLSRLFGEGEIEFGDPIGIGPGPSLFLVAFAEVVCALLVIIGLKSRWAAIPLVIAMLVAALIAHGADPFGRKELPLLYAAVFLAIFLLGPGKFSIDRK
ncbi:DoxX family protein [Robiginitalea sp. SC105]|uniref:DoxX family protein n=1 Tax=Robiginitalea sp. SC105 TaxID=2762332 RepID=UPI00163AE811|nr:DoxX family protein [Robiginitalea sp. SC105]MBC2840481.1 DoxX family protein [Robiginitalea sp. SC105]